MVEIRYLLAVAVAMTLTVVATANADAAGPRDDVATVRDLPPLTQKNHPRIMTMQDGTSTSKCIGKLITPLCAVETKIACITRHDQRLCDLIDFHFIYGKSTTASSTRYLISRATIIDDRHFPWHPSVDKGQPAGTPSVRAGDVRIDVRVLECFRYDRWICAPSYDTATAHVVRKENGIWRLIGWKHIEVVPW